MKNLKMDFMKKDKIFNNLGILGLFVYAVSIFLSKAGMNIGLGLMIIGLVSIDLKKEIKNMSKILKYFFLVVMVTPIWALFSDGGLNSSIAAAEKIYRFIPIFIGWLYLDSEKKQILILNGLNISVIINFISGMIFYGEKNWNFDIRYTSVIEHPLDNGHVASVLFIVLLNGAIWLYKKNRVNGLLFLIGSLLSFAIVIMSKGRGAWLSIIGGVGVMILLSLDYKKILILLTTLIFSLGLLSKIDGFKNSNYVKRFQTIKDYTKDDSPLIRVIMWEGVIDTYKKNRVFGVGRDNLAKWLVNYIDENKSEKRLNNKWNREMMYEVAKAGNPHNMYMVALGEMGLMSLALIAFWLLIYIDSIKTYIQKKTDYPNLNLAVVGSLTSLYITGLTESSWRGIWKANTYVLIVIIYISIKRREKNKEQIDFK